MKNRFIALLFSCIFIFTNSNIVFASTVYHDISTVSVKLSSSFIERIEESDTYSDNYYPDEISITTEEGSDGLMYNGNDSEIYSSSSKYYVESAEWYSYTTQDFAVGGQPKIIVYLQANDYPSTSNDRDHYYRFLSSYSSSTCSVQKGTLLSATRIGYENLKIVFSLQPIKGTFHAPVNAEWDGNTGKAIWESDPDYGDSGYYDVTLYRGSSPVTYVSQYKGKYYNFASQMKREGDYSFKVRAVAAPNGVGKSSEYTESGAVYVNQNGLITGNSQYINYSNLFNETQQNNNNYNNNNSQSSTNTQLEVGWVKRGDIWYFIKPDGQMVRNAWQKWNDKWYFLGDDGAMMVGDILVNGLEYYMNSDGAMITGWLKKNGLYYFYDPTVNSTEGHKVKEAWVFYDGRYYYFDQAGVMVTGWKQINGSYYYFYPENSTGSLYGYMATNTNINGFIIGADGKWVQ